MAHAAQIENGIVAQVIVIPDGLGGDENDQAVQDYINGIGLSGTWLRTSYNCTNGFRGKYAALGDAYDPDLDEFVSPA